MLPMDKARSRLEISDLNVTEAALEASCSSLGHFAAAFKKRFGTLPSEYRAEDEHLPCLANSETGDTSPNSPSEALNGYGVPRIRIRRV